VRVFFTPRVRAWVDFGGGLQGRLLIFWGRLPEDYWLGSRRSLRGEKSSRPKKGKSLQLCVFCSKARFPQPEQNLSRRSPEAPRGKNGKGKFKKSCAQSTKGVAFPFLIQKRGKDDSGAKETTGSGGRSSKKTTLCMEGKRVLHSRQKRVSSSRGRRSKWQGVRQRRRNHLLHEKI